MTENKIKDQVERIGIVCDKDGFPPLAGRLLGYLMLAEPPHKSFDEIVEFLQASKSAVSNTLKFLESQKMIEYITFPGDRKRYFKMSVEKWAEVMMDKMEWLQAMHNQITLVLSLRSDSYPKFNEGLQNIRELYEIIMEEMPLMVERWKMRIAKRERILSEQ